MATDINKIPHRDQMAALRHGLYLLAINFQIQ